jgi:hypothetical protein
MSEKRAHIDGTLRGTATSGLFAQDLEDMVDAPAAATPPVETAKQALAETTAKAKPSKHDQMIAKYNDLVKQALVLGIGYIPAKELTDDASLEAAGKALANKIESAKAEPRPGNQVPLDDPEAQELEEFFNQRQTAATA